MTSARHAIAFKTPPKPACELPVASSIGVLTVGMKEYKVKSAYYILCRIDGFTCFCMTTFLHRNYPDLLVKKFCRDEL